MRIEGIFSKVFCRRSVQIRGSSIDGIYKNNKLEFMFTSNVHFFVHKIDLLHQIKEIFRIKLL